MGKPRQSGRGGGGSEGRWGGAGRGRDRHGEERSGRRL